LLKRLQVARRLQSRKGNAADILRSKRLEEQLATLKEAQVMKKAKRK